MQRERRFIRNVGANRESSPRRLRRLDAERERLRARVDIDRQGADFALDIAAHDRKAIDRGVFQTYLDPWGQRLRGWTRVVPGWSCSISAPFRRHPAEASH